MASMHHSALFYNAFITRMWKDNICVGVLFDQNGKGGRGYHFRGFINLLFNYLSLFNVECM